MMQQLRILGQKTLRSRGLVVASQQWKQSRSGNVRFLSEGGDRIHSTDIAFKPAESGWGGTQKYSSNYDKIFGKKKGGDQMTTNATSSKSGEGPKKD